MYLALFLIAINLFKLLLAPAFPLIGDEAYYWLWSKHLALNYVDHPPMIAYYYALLTSIFGNTEFAVRFGAFFSVFLSSIAVYFTGKELHNKRTGEIAAIIFNLLPMFFAGGMFLVPQSILFFFWALSFYLLVRLIKSNDHRYWYLLGITVGLGIQSDFAMAMFIPAVFIYLLAKPEKRFWLKTPYPYLGILLTTLIAAPMLYWEKLNNFPSFSYHKERASAPSLNNLIYSAVLQIIFYTPFIFTDVIKTIVNAIKQRKNILAGIFSGVIFLPFTLIGAFMPIGGHWTATAYLPSLFKESYKKAFLITTLVFAVLVNGLGIVYYLSLYPVPKKIQGREYTINAKLKEYCLEKQKKGPTYFFSNNLGVAGLVAFYGEVPAYMPKGRHLQYDIWGQPQLKIGDDLVYFALNEKEIADKLKPLFNKVTIDPETRLFTKDGDIPNLTVIYICERFRGGKLP